MVEKGNSRGSLSEIRLALQAREALQTLERSNGTANDDLLHSWLSKVGLAISRRDLISLLDRLECEGFVRGDEVEGRRVIKLTREGMEITQDISRCEWIAPSI
jgi:hypothetical protein